ncbi:Holliday junction branch migration protein RuvA [Mycoplasma buteonis]|uniref:Holliday junction branch migration protein RuvA n=1 Tax=Mycoplasma buteonis TaxID=171280 RepID=UPI00055A6A9A|nr:Holliday junction branch migration protein RuvA [Mycoplasma buteonis]
MILYKIGEIVYKNKGNIILESGGTGYILSVPQENRFEVGQKLKLYLYEYRTDYLTNTYGFKDFKERLLFIDLISIDKIGPRIALSILDTGWETVATFIANEQWQELTKYNFVSEKTAKLICVELRNKWNKLVNSNNKNKDKTEVNNLTDLAKTLATLGFKKHQIDFALSKIHNCSDLDKMVEESIEIIASNNKIAQVNG